MRTKATTGLAVAVALVTAMTTGCGGDSVPKENPADYPSRELDWTIAFGPGGGNDIMSRTMVRIMREHDMYPANIVVENREGGSGATGWGHLLDERGNPYVISTTSGSFLTTPLQADTGWTYDDFTHIGLFATDDILFITPTSKGIDSWKQWLEYAKGQESVAVGGIGTVNVDFIVQQQLAEQAGYKIDYVPFNDEGQLQSALLSGTLDGMVSNPGSIVGQVQAGEVNALLYTGPERLDDIPDVPVAAEFGYEGLVSMPRGLVLPPDAPDYAREWWIRTMKRVVRTEEWQEYLDKNYLTPNVKWGGDFESHLDQNTREFEQILKEQGAIE